MFLLPPIPAFSSYSSRGCCVFVSVPSLHAHKTPIIVLMLCILCLLSQLNRATVIVMHPQEVNVKNIFIKNKSHNEE